MAELAQLTEELWAENADGRLNALRLKKSLNLISRKYTWALTPRPLFPLALLGFSAMSIVSSQI